MYKETLATNAQNLISVIKDFAINDLKWVNQPSGGTFITGGKTFTLSSTSQTESGLPLQTILITADGQTAQCHRIAQISKVYLKGDAHCILCVIECEANNYKFFSFGATPNNENVNASGHQPYIHFAYGLSNVDRSDYNHISRYETSSMFMGNADGANTYNKPNLSYVLYNGGVYSLRTNNNQIGGGSHSSHWQFIANMSTTAFSNNILLGKVPLYIKRGVTSNRRIICPLPLVYTTSTYNLTNVATKITFAGKNFIVFPMGYKHISNLSITDSSFNTPFWLTRTRCAYEGFAVEITDKV